MQNYLSFIPTVKVYSHYPARIKTVSNALMTHLSAYANLKISIHEHEEQSDVKLLFCPIVSRAGTDIQSALARVTADKPTIMFVLHHTFDRELNAPSSSSYEKDNLVMVDMLFHEDSGLLDCSKNNEAITKAGRYLKKYSRPHVVYSYAKCIWQVMRDKRAQAAFATVVVGLIIYKKITKR